MDALTCARLRTTQPLASFKLPGVRAEIFDRAGDVAPEIWDAAFSDQPKDFAYYALIEKTMKSHFAYRYLLLTSHDGTPIALQPLVIAIQDLFVSAHPWLTRLVDFIRKRAPRFLRSRILMAGCLVGDGHLGLTADSPPGVSAMVADALELFAAWERISLVTFKDFPATQRTQLDPLRSAGYTRLAGFPPLDLDLRFDSFEKYLETRLSKVTRKNLRRKLRKADSTEPRIELEVLTNADGVIDEIYPLYLNVAERSEVAFEVFTREYFLEAAREMPGRFRYFIWRRAGRAIAFSFCTVWNNTIYDNDIGLDYEVAHDLHLYYLTFRDIIMWALRNRFTTYKSAPFNYDPKLHLRLTPTPVDIYVRHRSPMLNAIIARVAPMFAPAKSDPALRRYLSSSAGE